MGNSLSGGYNRITEWLRKERQKGQSSYQTVFFGLPKMLALRSYRLFAAGINASPLNYHNNLVNFTRFQHRHHRALGGHFYIIVLPGTLHFLMPCLELLPANLSVFLILNGTQEWENAYLKQKFSNRPSFKLATLPHSSLAHGRVLNLLLENNHQNFGILDHDLYIFSAHVFDQLALNYNQYALGAFELSNKKAGISFPTTHFLYFNTRLVKKIMHKYRIDARQYKRILPHLEEDLSKMNLGRHNYLKEYLNYFDTMNLIMAMAHHEGMAAGTLKSSVEEIYHIGGTSYGSDSIYATYLNLKLLELPVNGGLKEKHSNLCANFKSSSDVLAKIPDSTSSLETIARINHFTSLVREKTQK